MKNKLFTILTMVAMTGTLLVGCGAQTAGIVAPVTSTELAAGAGNIVNIEVQEDAVQEDAVQAIVEVTEDSDLEGAKQMAMDFFLENFAGCVLNSFEYVDSYSAEEYAQIAASYGADEAVIFTSDFYVPETCENMVLNPGMAYEDYTYTLTRNVGEEWVIQTCGMQ